MIEVTAALLRRGERLLVCQRPEGKRCALLWEFPGGKIEPGETPQECLARECREELDIQVRPLRLIGEAQSGEPDARVRVRFYLCTLLSGEPRRLEHRALAWLTLDEILALPLCPADAALLGSAGEALRALLAGPQV